MKKALFVILATMSISVFADDKEYIRQAQRYGADTQIEVTVVHEDECLESFTRQNEHG